MKIESSVKVVRILRRQTFIQINGGNFIAVRSAPFKHAFIQVQSSLGAFRGMRVVRHHHDGFAVVTVESLQQIENLFAGFAVEVSRGFVAEQQRRIRHDRAGDANALFLASGQLARIVLHAIREPHDFQGDGNSFPPLRLRQLR